MLWGIQRKRALKNAKPRRRRSSSGGDYANLLHLQQLRIVRELLVGFSRKMDETENNGIIKIKNNETIKIEALRMTYAS